MKACGVLCFLVVGITAAPNCAETDGGTCDAARSPALLQKTSHVSDKVDASEDVDAQPVRARTERAQLVIEQDWRKFAANHYRAWDPSASIDQNAHEAFVHFGTTSHLSDELSTEERLAFEARFTAEIDVDFKHDPGSANGTFQTYVAQALQHQRPVITRALVSAVNAAGGSYTVRYDSSMNNLSMAEFQAQQGLNPSEVDLMEVSKHDEDASFSFADVGASTPSEYDTRSFDPCAEIIGRIHSQGTCGSCWAFGTLSAVDSRLCIKTNGAFSGPRAQLSRGHTASCAKSGNADGCQGGWFSAVYNLLSQGVGPGSSSPGIVLGGDSGCLPYFGHGSGVDHFGSTAAAPACHAECVPSGSYSRTFTEDLYSMPDLIGRTISGGYSTSAANEVRSTLYTDGPVAAAINADQTFMGYNDGTFDSGCGNSPNHAISVIGYGQGYFDALNSWGGNWGNAGGFRAADCVFTHWSWASNIVSNGYRLPGSGPAPPTPVPVPTPAPADGWVLRSGSTCTQGPGQCIRSPNYPSAYPVNAGCTIDVVGSKSIQVVDFNTESGYDYLRVNGVEYMGTGLGLQDKIPTGVIEWVSDSSVTGSGWEICPEADQDETEPTTSPTVAPTMAPTATPTTAAPTAAPTQVQLAHTSAQYHSTDYSHACASEFGPEARTADWESDVLTKTEEDIQAFLQSHNIEVGGESLLLTKGGNAASGSRYYFSQRHDGNPPSGWAVHGQHGGLTLGSWMDLNMMVLCVIPNIPPTAAPTSAPAAPTATPTTAPTFAAPTAAPTQASRCQWGPLTLGSIAGHNILCESGKTITECESLCEGVPACKSIDFKVDTGACCLGDCRIGEGCDNDNDASYVYSACEAPTATPTTAPTFAAPTAAPTQAPTATPTTAPTFAPTSVPGTGPPGPQGPPGPPGPPR